MDLLPLNRSPNQKINLFEEIHLEDTTTRFYPKEEKENERASFSNKNPRQEQKGAFIAPSARSLKRSPVEQNTGKEQMRIPQ
uniref:Uncharacterized protein n=1 Tax=Sciurus vulgaris TaxID=55149 RepID=A0A8D2JQ60_SCIVU